MENYWTVIEVSQQRNKSGEKLWLCQCKCGTKKYLVYRSVIDNKTRSCGCLRKKLISQYKTTHGGRYTSEYRSWRAMKHRCLNKNHEAYHNYGGRGITIHPSWIDDFAQFFKDVGQRPSKNHSLDRYPDPNGNYTPGNVRWATKKEQANNRRPYKNNRQRDKTGKFI